LDKSGINDLRKAEVSMYDEDYPAEITLRKIKGKKEKCGMPGLRARLISPRWINYGFSAAFFTYPERAKKKRTRWSHARKITRSTGNKISRKNLISHRVTVNGLTVI